MMPNYRHLLSTCLLAISVAASGLAHANCEDLAKGFKDAVPKRADYVNIVGQDFDTVLERGYITFAVYEDFAPYSWKSGTEAKGIDIDIAKVIAEEMGVEAKFNFFASDENVDADFRNQVWRGGLINGEVSNIMMHAPYNKDLQCRNEFVVLGGQYFNETLATAYRIDAFPDGVPTTPYYRFHKVGVENDTISAFYLANFNGGMLMKNVIHYPDHQAAFRGLLDKQVDAVMGVKGKLEYMVQSNDTEEKVAVDTPPLVNFSLNEWTIGIAVNFRYREIYYTADGVIEDMVKDGRMKKVFEKYQVSYTKPDY
ncbi:substrate-binding periplasmic protein [Leucothrix pacifica]|uniref:Amino acid ABC transporter substrate-binding protein n=1 Tax=Leucothrix pacifica TaxID=1247513 RepID=A0A317C2P0_9GAMM|nr:transporter substrate-binding domain-containing protein [Leucothrix pacifica]PWQ92451.1 amino acid ABC transporter substrate-binding protein [Leucothrix pacifica]